jgi:copper transport protein
METDDVALSYPMMMSRWLGFLALFSLVGAVAFKYLVLRKLSRLGQLDDPFDLVASTGAAAFGLFAAVALVIATVAKLYGMTVSMSNVSGTTILLDTGWGWACVAQLAAALIAIVAFRIAHTNKDSGWSIAAICAIVVAITPSLTGHAIGSDQAVVNVPLDVLHVLAGSVWLGTLAVIVMVGIGAALKTPGTTSAGTRVAAMINAFSPIALVCGATIVVSGVIVSLLRLHPLSTLWTSGYGKVLIVKLGFVGLLFALGAWNWRRVKPRLTADEGLPALRQSARMELTAGAMVLAVTAFLVAMALPD